MDYCVKTTAKIKGSLKISSTFCKNKIKSEINAKLALNNIPCPFILCIDGGNANTLVYPGVNGLLNGGSA